MALQNRVVRSSRPKVGGSTRFPEWFGPEDPRWAVPSGFLIGSPVTCTHLAVPARAASFWTELDQAEQVTHVVWSIRRVQNWTSLSQDLVLGSSPGPDLDRKHLTPSCR